MFLFEPSDPLLKGTAGRPNMTSERGRTLERSTHSVGTDSGLFSDIHWSGNPQKAAQFIGSFVPSLPTVEATSNKTHFSSIVKNTLTDEQIRSYCIILRLEEISHLIKTGQFVPTDERLRSPSPTPEYDNSGKRKNTREFRYRKKLEDERMSLIELAIKIIPGYKAPDWYQKRPKVFEYKLYIETEKYPQINFIGLLIGPRGNTLKKLQQDSGAKIGIRGKGSVKEGKDVSPELNNLKDRLHCLITADSEEKINLAKKLCKEVMDKAIFSPVGQNDLKRNQLRELAKLNGTFRDNLARECINCGELGHSRNTCPKLTGEKARILNSIKCNNCGNIGHLAKDCKIENNKGNEDEMDKEFAEFMNEVNDDDNDESFKEENPLKHKNEEEQGNDSKRQKPEPAESLRQQNYGQSYNKAYTNQGYDQYYRSQQHSQEYNQGYKQGYGRNYGYNYTQNFNQPHQNHPSQAYTQNYSNGYNKYQNYDRSFQNYRESYDQGYNQSNQSYNSSSYKQTYNTATSSQQYQQTSSNPNLDSHANAGSSMNSSSYSSNPNPFGKSISLPPVPTTSKPSSKSALPPPPTTNMSISTSNSSLPPPPPPSITSTNNRLKVPPPPPPSSKK